MKLLIISTDKLVPLEDNPRKSADKDGHTKLIKLIKEHGFQNPLQVWRDPAGSHEDPYIILCGNHRYASGVELGMDKFPCVEYVGGRHSAIARAISDNKSNEWTTWDQKKLKEMMASLTLESEKMIDSLTGFDSTELDKMLAAQSDDGEGGPSEEDATPHVNNTSPALSRPGDIWSLGEHRLLCGDAKSEADIATLMNDHRADIVFTDPPYGMKLDTDFSTIGEAKKKRDAKLGPAHARKSGPHSKNYNKVIGDDQAYDPGHLFRDFGYCAEMFLWGGDYYAERIPKKNDGSWFVWDKRVVIEHVKFSLAEFETCWSKKKHARTILRFRWFGMMGTEAPEEDIHRRVHPNQKPVKMFVFMLGEYSKRGDIVVDPFLGSGSTLVACEKIGRRCYGIEIFPQYCDVILQRWATYTGKDPIRADGTKWSSLCPSG